MAANIDPDLRQRVLALVTLSSAGITASELAADVSDKLDDRQLKLCLQDLADAGIIASDEAANPRYIALGTDAASAAPTPAVPVGAPRIASPRTTAFTTECAKQAPVAAPIVPEASTAVPAVSDPDFEPMFDIAVPMLMTALMSRAITTAALRMQALRNEKAGVVGAAYVDYALARLDKLTAADAPRLGVTTEQFLRWQQSFRG